MPEHRRHDSMKAVRQRQSCKLRWHPVDKTIVHRARIFCPWPDMIFSTEPTKVTVIFTKQDITPGTKDWRKSVLYRSRSIVDLLMNRTMWANLILSYMTCLNVNRSLIQCLRASGAESLRWIWWLCRKVICCLQHERVVHRKWLITQLCAIV